MKRAFLVSVWFHLVMLVLVVVPTLHLGRRLLRPAAYQVHVVELPPEPAPPRIKPPPKPPPPKPKAPAKPKPIKPEPIKPKAEAPPPLKPTPQPPPEPAPKPETTPQPPPPTPPIQNQPVIPSPSLMVQPKIDMPEFDCSSYCGVLQDKLSREWKPPPVSAQGPVQAVVVFTINRDGRVDNVSLERSSGNFYFDQAALRAVMSAPLPPPPHTLTNSTLRVHAPFTLQGSP
jgi:TonB family protein